MKYIEENLSKNDKVVLAAEISPLAIVPSCIGGGVFVILGLSCIDDFEGWGLFLIFAGAVIILYKYLDMKCTHLGFSEKKLIGKSGIINTKSMDAPLDKVDSISVSKGLWGLIFNYRSIKINTGAIAYEFHYIKDGELFKKKLLEQTDIYERNRLKESVSQLNN